MECKKNKHNWDESITMCQICGVTHTEYINKLWNAEPLIVWSKPFQNEPKCECGVASVPDSYENHSSWCPIYKERK